MPKLCPLFGYHDHLVLAAGLCRGRNPVAQANRPPILDSCDTATTVIALIVAIRFYEGGDIRRGIHVLKFRLLSNCDGYRRWGLVLSGCVT